MIAHYKLAIEKLTDAKEIALVKAMVQKHLDYTKSEKAAKVLADWKNRLVLM